MKYNMFDKGQNETYKNKFPFHTDKLFYNESEDVYVCPLDQKMHYIGDSHRKSGNGFIQTSRRYQSKNCINCPLNGACHKSKTNRIIEINVNLKKQKQKAHELLNSEQGIHQRKKRCFDVEPVFANVRQNHGFRRFTLRGKEKVSIEWGLLAIAQNIRKKQLRMAVFYPFRFQTHFRKLKITKKLVNQKNKVKIKKADHFVNDTASLSYNRLKVYNFLFTSTCS